MRAAPTTTRAALLTVACGNALLVLALQLVASGRMIAVATAAPRAVDRAAFVVWCVALDGAVALGAWAAAALLLRVVRPWLVWSLLVAGGAAWALVVFVDDELYALQGVHLYSPVVTHALANAEANREIHLGAAALAIAVGGLGLLVVVHAIGARLATRRPAPLRPTLAAAAALAGTAALAVAVGHRRFVDVQSPLAGALPFAGVVAGSRPPPRTLTPAYPPLPAHAMAKRPDILVVAVESLRADAFTPALMPSLTRYAATHACVRSARHFSSGHATELGVFSLLYGLDAYRYEPFAAARAPSPMLTVLRDNGYTVRGASSSALAHWNGAGFIAAQLDGYREFPQAESWQRDQALVAWATSLPRAAPAFTFLFFDATHLDYSYPPAFEVDRPVLRGDFTRFIGRDRLRAHAREIVNRYRNAVRFVDHELGALLAAVGPDTVVIVTGDHGEEFWEEGLLGHSAPRFINPRVEVPLVFCLPDGTAPAVARSSHTDLLPTVLDWAGVRVPADGESLLRPRRGDLVVSGVGFPLEGGDVCLVGADHKWWLREDPAWRDHFRLLRVTNLDDAPAPRGHLDAHVAAFVARLHRFFR